MDCTDSPANLSLCLANMLDNSCADPEGGGGGVGGQGVRIPPEKSQKYRVS